MDSILVMGWVKYSRKGVNVKNGLKCEMDDGGVGAIYGIEGTNQSSPFPLRQNVPLAAEINKNLINLDTSGRYIKW